MICILGPSVRLLFVFPIANYSVWRNFFCLFIQILTTEGWKYPVHIKQSLSGKSAGFESTEKSVMLWDTPC